MSKGFLWFKKKTVEKQNVKILKNTVVDVYKRYKYEIIFINGKILEVTDVNYTRWKFQYYVNDILREESLEVGEYQYATSSILSFKFISVEDTIKYRRYDNYFACLNNIVRDKKDFEKSIKLIE